MAITYDGVDRTSSWIIEAETISPLTAQLWLDDELIATETNPGSGDNPDAMVLTIEHPYSDEDLRTWSGQEVEYPMSRGETYYVIIYDFGGSRDGRLLEQRQRKIKGYRLAGYDDESRQVITETLNVMGMTWMRDTTLNANLLDELSGVLAIRHHRFGVMAQESGYYIDVKAQKSSSVSRNNDSDALEARFKAGNFLDSALEHGVLEQMQVNRPAVSTIKLLHITNGNQDPVFLVTSDNFESIKDQLNYDDTDELPYFRKRVVNDGYTLILPANGRIALDSGAGGGWAGKGYIEFKNADDSMSCGMIINGGHYGGYAVVEATADAEVVDQKVTSNIQPPATQAQVLVGEPVDMTTGYWVSQKTDLALSGGKGGLAFKRTYFSGNHQIESELGYGWSHNCDLYAEVNSNTAFGLGQRLPTDSTALMAASVAILDLMAQETDIKDWMTGALTGKWAMDQLTDNAVNLHLESNILAYIKQPNGTFSLPPGINAKLVLDNGQYRLEDRFDRTIEFDAQNRVSTITDADQNTVTFTYSDDRPAGVSDSFGHTLTFGYTGDNLTSVTDSAGRSVSFEYTDGNLTTYTDPEGKVWTYEYDSDHRVLSLGDPKGVTTITNVYDSFGRVINQTAPRQTGTASYNYYFSGYRNVQEDSLGNPTVYTYDRKNRLVATQDALGNQATRSYDGQNHVIESIDPRGNATTFTYDGNNNLVRITDALSGETVNTYDGDYHLTQVADPLGNTVSYDYDDAHHLVKTTISPGSGETIETGASYHANGLTQTVTDGRGVVTTMAYDGYGNPATSQTASAPAIVYDYDGIGQMTSLTDQGGSQTAFVYDGRGLLQTRTDPLFNTTQMAYYDDGKLYTVTDRNGDTTTFTYTPSGKTASITYQDGTSVTFTYDKNDNLTAMQDSRGTTAYVYDEVNRLTSSTDPNGFTVGYEYDGAGNLVTLTYPGGKTVSYTYDALNRLETVTIDWLGLSANYEYDLAGNLTGLTQFNDTYVSRGYDNANRLTRLEHLSSLAGSAFASYAFTLDGNGNRSGIDQETPLSPSLSALTRDFEVSDAGNRIVTAGSDALIYDEEGQLLTKGEGTFTFDRAHRLTEAATETDSLIFSYDGAGNRLAVDRNQTVTRYIYDAAGNLLAEADTSGITRYYIHGAGLLAMVTSGGTPYCYHFDATGHTIALTDAGKTVVNKYAYTPFGVLAGEEEAVEQPFKFVGQFGVMTEDNGWYYMRARYYDPEMGRFISEDPLGFGGGDVNLYAYVSNNPINQVDPFGLYDLENYFYDSVTGTTDNPGEFAAYQNADYQVATEVTGQVLATTSIGSATALGVIGGVGALAMYGPEITTGALYIYNFISQNQINIFDFSSGFYFDPGEPDGIYSPYNSFGTLADKAMGFINKGSGCE
jgi:RHS repeat-associated protein